MKNRWAALEGKGYIIENLGRPFIFLIPVRLLDKEMEHSTVQANLHQFLAENFDAYTTPENPVSGFWRNSHGMIVAEQCREYEVSFPGKNKIPFLLKRLADIAHTIGEVCIYIKAGQYSALVYPKKSSD